MMLLRQLKLVPQEAVVRQEQVGVFVPVTEYLAKLASNPTLQAEIDQAAAGGNPVDLAMMGIPFDELAKAGKNGSKILRDNLIKAGVKVPNFANAAHHIVAGTSQKAIEARAVLKKFGVGINDSANGVFLPIVKNVTESAYHPSLHSDAYYRKVTELLSGASSKDDVLEILKDIADQLLDGTFMK